MGRDPELRQLARALDDARAGSGRMVTLEGEAGIGKTFLLEEALRRAQALGFRCFLGTAEELERHRPFGVLAESLDISRRAGGRAPAGEAPPATGLLPAQEGEETRRAALARLLSGERGGAGATQPDAASPPAANAGGQPRRDQLSSSPLGTSQAEFQIVDGLIDLVEHLCSAGPVVVALEDLQWSDHSTLLAINRLGREVMREVARLPVVLIATLRPLPQSPDLVTLLEGLQARGALRITLGQLDDAAVAELVQALVDARPGERLLGQVRRAGGNPFFATELVASLQREGAITLQEAGDRTGPGGMVAEVADRALPASLTNTILHRLNFLTEDALETLQVASILGSSFSVADLAEAVGVRASGIARLLSPSIRVGILADAGPVLAFRHDLIRQALYDSVPQASRAWWHLATAHVLAEAGRPHEDVAEHVVRGAVPGDLAAVEWLQTAAARAAGRSPAVAAELLQRALDLAPPGAPHRRPALADLAAYLLRCGRLPDAEAICRGLLMAGPQEGPTDVDEGTLRTCLIEALVGQGRVGETLEHLALAIASPGVQDAQLGRLWSWVSQCRAILWDLEGAADAAAQALTIAQDLQDGVGIAVALGNQAVVAHLRGSYPRAQTLAAEVLQQLTRQPGGADQSFYPALNLTATLMDLDCSEQAERTLRYWRQFRLGQGVTWNHPTDAIFSAVGQFWAGAWDQAAASLQAALDIAETTGVRRGNQTAHSLRALLALHLGNLAGAEREVSAAEADAASNGPQWRPDWMMLARALLLEAQGHAGEALRVLVKAWEYCSGAGAVAEYQVLGPDLVRLALAGGEEILAAEAVAVLEALATGAASASAEGAARRCRAMLDHNPAMALQAVDSCRAAPRPRELALALEEAAVLLAATGQAPQAQPLVEEALAIYHSLGARRDVARAQEHLHAAAGARARLRARATSADTAAGWGTLTPAEAAVARLVAQGRTNREIAQHLGISPRTVQSHVSSALGKLGLSSRVEIAVKAQRGRPDQP